MDGDFGYGCVGVTRELVVVLCERLVEMRMVSDGVAARVLVLKKLALIQIGQQEA